jgi:hypothetical protein
MARCPDPWAEMVVSLQGESPTPPEPRGAAPPRRAGCFFLIEDAREPERDYFAIAHDVRRGLAYAPPPRPRGRPKKPSP